MIGAYPFRVGDELRVSVRASVTTPVTLFARVRFVDGSDDLIEIPITHSAGDRTNELKRSSDLFKKAGWVEHLTVDTALNNARGRFYMMVAINKKPHHFPIAAGYIDIPHVPLGEFESAISGSGYEFIDTVVQDADGDVVTTYKLGVANARRIYHGLLLYLNADGNVAGRNPKFTLRHAYGSLPTGFAGGASEVTWIGSGPGDITATQEGLYYVSDGYAMENDAGSQALHDQSSEPNPLPIVVPSGLTDMEIDFAVGSGLAGDKYSAYAFVEEWIAP